MQKQGITAWVVTWDGTGGHAKFDPNEVVGFFPQSADIGYVRQQVEWIHAEKNYTLEERVAWTADPSNNPYKGLIEGEFVHCGHNPFLKARIVDDLVVRKDADGVVRGTWTERGAAVGAGQTTIDRKIERAFADFDKTFGKS